MTQHENPSHPLGNSKNIIFVRQTCVGVEYLNLGDLIDTLKGTWLLPFSNLVLINNLLLDHVVLPHVLDLAVYPANFLGWMSQGVHSETLLLLALLALFYKSTPSSLKVRD